MRTSIQKMPLQADAHPLASTKRCRPDALDSTRCIQYCALSRPAICCASSWFTVTAGCRPSAQKYSRNGIPHSGSNRLTSVTLIRPLVVSYLDFLAAPYQAERRGGLGAYWL